MGTYLLSSLCLLSNEISKFSKIFSFYNKSIAHICSNSCIKLIVFSEFFFDDYDYGVPYLIFFFNFLIFQKYPFHLSRNHLPHAHLFNQ